MLVVAKIDDREITSDDLVKILKFNAKFDDVMEDIMVDKITVAAAKKQGIDVSVEEIQERVDQLRRIQGLHRAKDTFDFLESLGISLEEFQGFVAETLVKEKVQAAITTEKAVQDYFSSNSPKFDSIEVSHMVIDTENKAKELLAALEDDPGSFADLAREHSLDTDTRDKGGVIGKVIRGSLRNEVEAKVFNAGAGEVLGPFESEDGFVQEIFKVDAKHPAKLDDATRTDVQKLVYEEWLEARVQEHRVEVL